LSSVSSTRPLDVVYCLA